MVRSTPDEDFVDATELWMDPLAGPYEAEGTSGDVVLLIHGWTGSPAHLRTVAERLESDGHAVVVPTLAGHGTTLEDMERTGRFHWIASVAGAYRRALQLGDRVHLFGFSMGGLLAIDLAAKHSSIATLTLLNVPHKFRDPKLFGGPVMKRFKRFHYWEENERGLPPGMEKYVVGYEGFPVSTAEELIAVRNQAIKRAGDVEAPTVVIQSRGDESVDPVSSDKWMAALGSSQKRQIWLEHSVHQSTLWDERHIIEEAAAAQVEEY